MLKGNQKKLDMNKNGKIDKADFKMLKNRKKYAGGGNVSTDVAVTISQGKAPKKQPRAQIAGFGKARK